LCADIASDTPIPTMQSSRFSCLFVASLMSITPHTAEQFLQVAREQVSLGEKITVLKRFSQAFPHTPKTQEARDQLVELLLNANRFEEALQQYQKFHGEPAEEGVFDFKLFDLLLRTGKYSEILRLTEPAEEFGPDLLRDMKLMEIRVQALLARGLYETARESVEAWITRYSSEIDPGSRFESDLRSLEYLQRHLKSLERMSGAKGKPIFTASVPHSMQSWSQKKQVPIVFFKLIPARAGGQLASSLLAGRHASASYFEERVEDLNKGFEYLSSGEFSLQFGGMKTLYISQGDMDPQSAGAHLLTSRVYAHTIPQIHKLAGNAFTVLIDYRAEVEDEAAYMGDGIIHLSASRLQTLVMMHEILHGLGATHQEWNGLQAQGYRFDPDDRGLMTFQHGRIVDLGLEEKNRALLGWPQVSVIRPRFNSDEGYAFAAPAPIEANAPREASAPAVATSPQSPELIPAL
jgi:tetratricopeptide (TPR) repeat protein